MAWRLSTVILPTIAPVLSRSSAWAVAPDPATARTASSPTACRRDANPRKSSAPLATDSAGRAVDTPLQYLEHRPSPRGLRGDRFQIYDPAAVDRSRGARCQRGVGGPEGETHSFSVFCANAAA